MEVKEEAERDQVKEQKRAALEAAIAVGNR